jgi:ribonuclease P protein component
MRREHRLTRSKDFAAVYRSGRPFTDRLLVLRAAANGRDGNRYGFVTAKSVGKAVVRNTVRRRLREVLRSQTLRSGWDIVIIARRAAAEADYEELSRSARGLLKRAGLLRQELGERIE